MNESSMQPSASESIPENTPLPLPAQPAAAGVDAAPLGSESADRNGAVTSSVPPSANERTSTSPPMYVKVIEPPSGWPTPDLAELWQYRDLLFLLIWSGISASHRQSVIGFGWVLVKAVTQTAAGTLVFSVIAGLE